MCSNPRITRMRPSHAALQPGHSPSTDNLHGDESRELHPGGILHVFVNLISPAAELSSFKQDNLRGDTEEDTVTTNTQINHCLDTDVRICLQAPATIAETIFHTTEDKLN